MNLAATKDILSRIIDPQARKDSLDFNINQRNSQGNSATTNNFSSQLNQSTSYNNTAAHANPQYERAGSIATMNLFQNKNFSFDG